jgi:biotin operon repressor
MLSEGMNPHRIAGELGVSRTRILHVMARLRVLLAGFVS